jgi:hypothetical protein
VGSDLSDHHQNDSPDHEELPKILTEPRDDSKNDENSSLGHIARFSVLSRRSARELGQFLDNWFANWFRGLLTGLVLGGIIALMYRCSVP